MSEPLPSETSRAADALSGVERDARVEQLLLQGLDHYFGADYEQAIHVWTRVLFLDRGQTRARAYIERARNALSERQRESEELLHRGVAAFDRGDAGDARTLLNAAVQRGVAPDVALSYLGRLDRLSPAPESLSSRAVGDPEQRPGVPASRATAAPHRRTELVIGLVLVGALVVWLAPLALEVRDLREALQFSGAAPLRAQADTGPALPVPRPAEVALDRARELFEAGHAMDAIGTLGVIGVADPLRPEADRLRAEIQRALLGAGNAVPESGDAGGGTR